MPAGAHQGPRGGAGGSTSREPGAPELAELLRLVRHLSGSGEIESQLQELANAVVEVLGFDAVAVNLVERDDNLRVVAVSGPADIHKLRDAITERAVIDELLVRSEAWGSLRFRDHRRAPGPDGDPGPLEESRRRAVGEAWRPHDVLLAPMHSSEGILLGVLSVDRPRTGRLPSAAHCVLLELFSTEGARAIEDSIRRREAADLLATYRTVFDVGPAGMVVLDDALRVVEANHAFGILVGRPASALAGKALASLLDPDDVASVADACRASIAGDRAPGSIEHRYLHATATSRWARSSFSTVRALSSTVRIVMKSEDVTEDRRERAERRTFAGHDALTGLPNRRSTLERVEAALARRRQGQQIAVLCVAVDQFKQINDGEGHAAGDEALQQVTRRLAASLRAGEQLFRFGGAEYVVLCEDVRGAQGAAALAARLIDCLAPPITLGARSIPVSASIGIAIVDDDKAGQRTSETLDTAGDALRQAKRLGGGHWHCAAPTERRKPVTR